MKKTIFQFTLRMLALTGGLVSFLLIDSIITGNIAFISGFILLLATAVLSTSFAYWSMATPAKSKKSTACTKPVRKAAVQYYSTAQKSHASSASGFHIA